MQCHEVSYYHRHTGMIVYWIIVTSISFSQRINYEDRLNTEKENKACVHEYKRGGKYVTDLICKYINKNRENMMEEAHKAQREEMKIFPINLNRFKRAISILGDDHEQRLLNISQNNNYKRDDIQSLPECELESLMTYLARLQVISPESIIQLASGNNINEMCKTLKNNLKDIDEYLARCHPPQQKELYLQLINGVRELDKIVCIDQEFKKAFISHAPCFLSVTEKYNACVGPADWIEEPNPSQVCKTFKDIENCYYNKTEEICGHESALLMRTLTKGIINSVLTVDCGSTSTVKYTEIEITTVDDITELTFSASIQRNDQSRTDTSEASSVTTLGPDSPISEEWHDTETTIQTTLSQAAENVDESLSVTKGEEIAASHNLSITDLLSNVTALETTKGTESSSVLGNSLSTKESALHYESHTAKATTFPHQTTANATSTKESALHYESHTAKATTFPHQTNGTTDYTPSDHEQTVFEESDQSPLEMQTDTTAEHTVTVEELAPLTKDEIIPHGMGSEGNFSDGKPYQTEYSVAEINKTEVITYTEHENGTYHSSEAEHPLTEYGSSTTVIAELAISVVETEKSKTSEKGEITSGSVGTTFESEITDNRSSEINEYSQPAHEETAAPVESEEIASSTKMPVNTVSHVQSFNKTDDLVSRVKESKNTQMQGNGTYPMVTKDGTVTGVGEAPISQEPETQGEALTISIYIFLALIGFCVSCSLCVFVILLLDIIINSLSK